MLKSLLLHFVINSITTVSSVSVASWSNENVIININKGYALRRVGIYSPDLTEEIVHTFIPLNHFCTASPETSVCLYASLRTKTSIISLATMIASHRAAQTLPFYNAERVSRLINQDIRRVLMQHNPEHILKSSKSMIHFVNNQFHYQNAQDNAITTKAMQNEIENYSDVDRLPQLPAEIIRKQISSNKIGLQYLSKIDLRLFLAAVFSTIDNSYSVSDIEKSLDTFSKLIIGQCMFALRYCSFNHQNVSSSEPCLAISTLFLRSPTDTRAKFSIYSLIPLPVVHRDEVYIYSKLPHIIGINSVEQTIILWKEQRETEECLFSEVVQCRSVPVSFPLSKASCLTQLLDENQPDTKMCQVTKSTNIQEDVMRIDDGIWLFYNTPHAQQCQVYASSTDLTESISIIEPTIVTLSCNKTITCSDYQLPASPCLPHQSISIPRPTPYIRSRGRFLIPLRNMTRTIVAAYNSQSETTIENLMQTLNSKKSIFKKLFEDFLGYVVTFFSLILFLLFIYIFKFIKCKIERQIHSIESIIEDLLTNRV